MPWVTCIYSFAYVTIIITEPNAMSLKRAAGRGMGETGARRGMI